MKIKLLYLVLLLTLNACSHSVNFDWLEGDWKEVNPESPEEIIHESWKKKNNNYVGWGYAVNVSASNDTTYYEQLFLQKIDEIWNYRALVPSEHGQDTINFPLSDKSTNDSITFFNYQNEFPSTITYVHKKDSLKVYLGAHPTLKQEAVVMQFIKIH